VPDLLLECESLAILVIARILIFCLGLIRVEFRWNGATKLSEKIGADPFRTVAA
jgi:hypothetical protein